MIADKDRSGYFGGSDVEKIIGKWTSATFEKWWLQKLGINRDHFDNKYTLAGTHYEHRILESLGIDMAFDKQIIIEDLLLRVNLDGNTNDEIYECKTYCYEKGFKLPKKYEHQVWVQMFAFRLRKAKIIAYGLTENDYDNYFNPIDKERLSEFVIEYDEKWICEVFLPRLIYLAECLRKGAFPNESEWQNNIGKYRLCVEETIVNIGDKRAC